MGGTFGFNGLRDLGFDLPGGSIVEVGKLGRARLRYNEAINELEVSKNGAAYVIIGGGSGPPLATTAPPDVDKSTAAVGVSGSAARADHKHDAVTASAVEITDSTSDEGSGAPLARADHAHAHGDRGGGSLHALATTSVAGFMSPADKTKLGDVITESVRSWAFETANTGIDYVGGFYEFGSTDDDFSPSINFGNTNRAIAAHLFVVTGAVPANDVTIRVTGTSITDAGVRTLSDTEDIVIPTGTPVDSYFEFKKWLGLVSVQTVSGTPITCNYGWAKYHDNNNQDFEVIGLESLWQSESTDTTSDLALLHHKAAGWTFNAGAEPTPPVAIARRSTDYGSDNGHQNGLPGAWKRTNLATVVAGSAAEGIIVEITSASAGVGNQSFRQLNFEVSIEGD
jgi:hypothetical protein